MERLPCGVPARHLQRQGRVRPIDQRPVGGSGHSADSNASPLSSSRAEAIRAQSLPLILDSTIGILSLFIVETLRWACLGQFMTVLVWNCRYDCRIQLSPYSTYRYWYAEYY
eukprot:COSAG02_NODE_2975_length_7633_cov_3.190072_5_plen_112_part_00